MLTLVLGGSLALMTFKVKRAESVMQAMETRRKTNVSE